MRNLLLVAAAAAAFVLGIRERPVAASDAMLTFGAAVSLTGREAREGTLTKEGYEAWKKYVNEHGGFKVGSTTYHVDIKYYDDETNPQTSAKLVEKLVTQDHVSFLLGPYGTGSTYASAPVAERLRVPMVEANGASERIFSQGFQYTFGVLAPGRRYLEGILQMAKAQKNGPRTVAVASANDSFSLEVGQGAIDYARANGFNVVYNERYPADTTDLSSVASSIKSTHAEIVLNAGHLQDALLLSKALKEQNILAKMYGYSVGPSTPDFKSSLGHDANYALTGTQWAQTSKIIGAPGFYRTSPEYAKAFTAQFGHEPDYHNAESTAACLAFQYAMQRAGSIDPMKVRDALAKLDVVTFFGILKFDSRGLNVYKPMIVSQIQNGRLVTVWPASAADAPPQLVAPAWAAR